MKKLSRGKRIAICVGGFVAAFAVVFGVLLLTHKKLDYSDALADTEQILATKDTVANMFAAEEVLDDDGQGEFDAAVQQLDDAMQKLRGRSALENEEIATSFKAVEEKYAKLYKITKAEQVLEKLYQLEELNDDSFAAIRELNVAFLNEMVNDLEGYRADTKSFAEEYANKDNIEDDELIEAYGNIQIQGEELIDKYADLSLDKVFGVSRDEALSFYDSVEELNEKISARL